MLIDIAQVQSEIVPFPLPNAIAQDGAFGDRAVPGMTRKNAIALEPPIVKQDVVNLATAMDLMYVPPLKGVLSCAEPRYRHKGKSDAVKLGEWDSVLKLTGIDMPFDFEKLREGLRKDAIAGIDALAEQGLISPAMLLSLGLDNSIARWIACPAEELARRDEILSREERKAIGHRYSSALNDIRQDSFMWSLRQKVAPGNGRQDYPNFWYSVVKDAFADELAEDRDWLPLLESPCAHIHLILPNSS